MKKRKILLEEYMKLEEEKLKLVSDKLALTYQINNLQADYKRERDQSDEIRKLHENARRLKHDMKNHIMVIAAYLNANEQEKAKEYLSKIMDKLNLAYSYIETGNSIMNYILNTKLENAQKKDILVKAEIENLSFQRMESVDFSALLSNLLDNAIEACQQCSLKEINVAILHKRGYDTILIKNRINHSVLNDNSMLRSTKSDVESHGLGIIQIRGIVEKYDGLIDFYEENSMFCAYTAIPSSDIS